MSGLPDDDENPFGDPSVQNAVTSNQTAKVDLDDYNPFDGKTTTNQNSAVMSATEEPPPAVTVQPQAPPSQVSTADFQRRQEELERRARELDRREQEIRNAPTNVKQNNWPPLPKICPIQPCFYQDINVDIPVEFQQIVKYVYYLWIGHTALRFYNVLIGLLFLFVGGLGGLGSFIWAVVMFVAFTPLSYLLWFRPVYKAFRDDSSISFMLFFFVFFFQMLVSILRMLGWGNGSSGLILGFQTVSAGASGGLIFVGILMIIDGVGYGIAALADFYVLTRVHKMYRSTGASLDKAKQEFTTGVMSNEAVRQAATDAAAASMRSQFANQGPNGSQPPNNDNRY